MAEEADDKQHKASSKRLTEMRKKGNVMRSRDFIGDVIDCSWRNGNGFYVIDL